MPSAFDVLGRDHEEVKRMCTELELGPTVSTGASRDQLALRERMVRRLVVEESKHEAIEDLYFWPVVRARVHDGTELANQAQDQQRQAQEALGELERLTPEDEEFEARLAEFIRAGRAHVAFQETTVWPGLWAVLSGAEADDVGQRLLQAKRAAFAQPTSRRLRGAA
jgi:Hemerythrin HHE cation binding domain